MRHLAVMLLYALALTHGRSALKEYLPKSKQPSPFPRSPHCDETVQKKFACRITKTRRPRFLQLPGIVQQIGAAAAFVNFYRSELHTSKRLPPLFVRLRLWRWLNKAWHNYAFFGWRRTFSVLRTAAKICCVLATKSDILFALHCKKCSVLS